MEKLSELSNCKSDLFCLPFSPHDKTLAEPNQAVIPKSKEGSKSVLPSSNIDSFAVWVSVKIV